VVFAAGAFLQHELASHASSLPGRRIRAGSANPLSA
jgi:hypothetical protein